MRRVAGLVALLLCAPAAAQDQQAVVEPPEPFTLVQVQKLYQVGLRLKYKHEGTLGRAHVVSYTTQEVVAVDEDGFTLRTTRFKEDGSQRGGPTQRKLPWKSLLAKRSGQPMPTEEAELALPAGNYPAVIWARKLPREDGSFGVRREWYAKVPAGLLLKSEQKVKAGTQLGRELIELRLRRGEAPRSRLPWGDGAIAKTWKAGSRMTYRATIGPQQLTIDRTITKSNRQGFSERDVITDAAGKVVLDREKAHPWADWLRVLKTDPSLKIGEPVDVQAAGKVYRCKPYTIVRRGATETSFLALDVPGLTVKFVSVGGRVAAERVLMQLSFGKK